MSLQNRLKALEKRRDDNAPVLPVLVFLHNVTEPEKAERIAAWKAEHGHHLEPQIIQVVLVDASKKVGNTN